MSSVPRGNKGLERCKRKYSFEHFIKIILFRPHMVMVIIYISSAYFLLLLRLLRLPWWRHMLLHQCAETSSVFFPGLTRDPCSCVSPSPCSVEITCRANLRVQLDTSHVTKRSLFAFCFHVENIVIGQAFYSVICSSYVGMIIWNKGGWGVVTPTIIKTSQCIPLPPLKWVETSTMIHFLRCISS